MNNHYQDTDPSSASAFEPDELPTTPRRPRRRVMAETAPSPSTTVAPEPTSPRIVYTAPAKPERAERPVRRPADGTTTPRPAAAAPAPAAKPSRPAAKKEEDEEKGPGLIARLIADGRFKIFSGIIFIVLALYIVVAFISFFAAAGAADQSMVISAGLSQSIERSTEIHNVAGPFGAWLSQTLISDGMGVGAVMIPVFLACLGLGLVGLRRLSFWSLAAKSMISMIALSVVIGMVTYRSVTLFYWGGRHGHDVNQFLLSTVGVWGMIGVSIILVAAVAMIFLKQITDACRVAGAFIERRREAARARREAARQAKAERDEKAKPQPKAKDDDEEDDDDEEEDEEGKDALLSVSLKVAIGNHDDKPLEFEGDTPAPDTEELLAEAEARAALPAPEPMIDPLEAVDTVTDAAPIEQAEEETHDIFDPTAELSHYHKPSVELLIDRPLPESALNEQEQTDNINNIRRVLSNFGIEIARIEATVGPTVTLYEIVPAEGVRINKIRSLEDDIALSLAALGIRIIAPMPGKGTIGIEVPNKNPQIVSIRAILSSRKFQESKAELPMAMGATISNDVYIADLTKMPHLLVAGSTGMGKSVGLNTIIASIIYKKHPAEVKFVMIDPKMVEFSLYNKMERHFLAKLPGEEEAIITNIDKVVPTLLSLCTEMDSRYELLKSANVRSIKEYNEKFINLHLNPNKGHRFLPYIVVVIDEFADLIMTAGKEVETPIARIAQKARAVGIHVILATQRPSANIITGVIRANFPGRIAFRVTQQLESRIILDRPGANQLIGRGDMLFSRDGSIERVQCAFIDTPEVEAICDEIASQVGYSTAYELPEPPLPEGAAGADAGNPLDRDPLFEAAAREVIDQNLGSTSMIQRRFEIGYPRAGKIMDQLERAGVVGPAQGGKPRKVLMTGMDFDQWLSCTGTTQRFPSDAFDD